MRGDKRKADESSQKGPASPGVGYGKPPREHQFPKGKSGNPNGRPKKKAPLISRQPLFPAGYGLQIGNRILMDEAYRPVTIREGEDVFEIPMIRGVMRALGVAALKGNRHAQRTVLELVQRIELLDREQRRECVEAIMKYKAEWTRAIAKARAAGRPEPQPLPHPDDIVIDDKTGDIFVCGPDNEEEKRRWDKRLQRRSDAQEEVSYCASEWRKARGPRRKAMWINAQSYEQKIFDIINDNLPRRYRTELKDRSYASGLSRPGSQRHVVWPD